MLSRSRTDLRNRLAQRLPALLEHTLEQMLTSVPYYRMLEQEHLDSDVADDTRANLELFARLLREDRLPEQDEIGFLLRSVANRAEERIPLPDVLSAYYAGFRACWDELSALAEPRDGLEMVQVGKLVLAYLSMVTVAITETYVETSSALVGREREARVALLGRVLEGVDTPADWSGAGLTAYDEITVVSLRHPGPRLRDPVASAVESRRRVRAVREALARVAGTDPLWDLATTGGTLVLRGTVPITEVEAALRKVVRSRWWAGVASAVPGPAAAEACTAASSCAEVASRLRRPTGAYGLEQLLFEVQVTQAGPARARLHGLLASLDEHPDLLATLTAHVAESGGRTATAERLHVHPNTLDYRLRRIRELTGLDPTDRDGGQLARAALVVRTFLDAEEPGRSRL